MNGSSRVRGVVLTCAAGLLAGAAAAGQRAGSLEAGVGALTGDTTYRIGGLYEAVWGSGQARFPVSELEFPLDVATAVVGGRAAVGARGEVYARAVKSITEDAGTALDSDWGIVSADDLDVYSESDAELDALQAEAGARLRLGQWAGVDLMAGAGYGYRRFDFDIVNLDQWYPSDPYRPHDVVPGAVATYEVTYRMPYVEAVGRMDMGDGMQFELRAGYSPLAEFEDEDHHLLRSRVARGEGDGEAAFLAFAARYRLGEAWHLAADASFCALSAEGTSVTAIDGAFDHRIEQENETEQAAASLSLGYAF